MCIHVFQTHRNIHSATAVTYPAYCDPSGAVSLSPSASRPAFQPADSYGIAIATASLSRQRSNGPFKDLLISLHRVNVT